MTAKAKTARIAASFSVSFTRYMNPDGALVGKLYGLLGAVGDVLFIQRVLEAHDAEPDRSVTQVGDTRLWNAVVVVVDDIVEHAHCGGNGALQFFQIKAILVHVLWQVD